MTQTGTVRRAENALSRIFSSWFPVPQLLLPRTLGIDVSDASIKWLVLGADRGKQRVVSYGDEPLQKGIVEQGIIQDIPAFTAALTGLKEKWNGIECVHAALPEETAYVFNMYVPVGSGREQTLRMIEFELEGRVPIPPSQAVYDFNIITEHDGDKGTEVGVAVFAREHAQSYAEVFHDAGIRLLSLEVEARSIARAVSSDAAEEPITLLVDFGRERTSFAVLKRGIPIFTSTVGVGGNAISRVLQEKAHLSEEEAVIFKDEQGLFAEKEPKSPEVEAVIGSASALADEVAKHYQYWDTRRNERGERMTPVERIILVGGSSNLKGLDDYLAGRVQTDVYRGNVWRNVCEFDEYIPPIDFHTSLQYATAIGLALRGI